MKQTARKWSNIKLLDVHDLRLRSGYFPRINRSQNIVPVSPLVISTFKFGYLHFTLKEGFKLKSYITRFQAHDVPHVRLPSKTSKTNNKRVMSTFKFGYPHLTLKEGPKVKSDHIRRFAAHDFL